jgi:hypothetical protein
MRTAWLSGAILPVHRKGAKVKVRDFIGDAQMAHITRAALASGNLDRSRWTLADVVQHGCGDCLDAPEWLPTGGYGYATVIGSRAHVKRG